MEEGAAAVEIHASSFSKGVQSHGRCAIQDESGASTAAAVGCVAGGGFRLPPAQGKSLWITRYDELSAAVARDPFMNCLKNHYRSCLVG